MHSSLGLAIIVFSGGLIASFAAPMKLSHAWNWENTWLTYATLALVVIPLVLVVWAIPHPIEGKPPLSNLDDAATLSRSSKPLTLGPR